MTPDPRERDRSRVAESESHDWTFLNTYRPRQKHNPGRCSTAQQVLSTTVAEREVGSSFVGCPWFGHILRKGLHASFPSAGRICRPVRRGPGRLRSGYARRRGREEGRRPRGARDQGRRRQADDGRGGQEGGYPPGGQGRQDHDRRQGTPSSKTSRSTPR